MGFIVINSVKSAFSGDVIPAVYVRLGQVRIQRQGYSGYSIFVRFEVFQSKSARLANKVPFESFHVEFDADSMAAPLELIKEAYAMAKAKYPEECVEDDI